jgi:hypothetical protein
VDKTFGTEEESRAAAVSLNGRVMANMEAALPISKLQWTRTTTDSTDKDGKKHARQGRRSVNEICNDRSWRNVSEIRSDRSVFSVTSVGVRVKAFD